MGTANFYNENASKIYAVEIEDEIDYEDLLLNTQSALETLAKKKGYYFIPDSECDAGGDWRIDRNFPANPIGKIESKTKDYMGIECRVDLCVVSRGGYYSGANLDWTLEYICDDSYEEIDDIDFDYYFEGRAKQYKEWITNFLEEQADQLIADVEGVLEEVTTPLVVTARFSSGETMYGKAEFGGMTGTLQKVKEEAIRMNPNPKNDKETEEVYAKAWEKVTGEKYEYAKGGLTKGKSHKEGGIPMTVKSTGQKIEVEGGEGIINKHSMSSDKKYEYEGKEKTTCEIASDLNQKEGEGVGFSCDTVESKKYKFMKGGKTKNPRLKKGDSVWVDARKWQDSNGNTYHNVNVYVNGDHIGESGQMYGYGTQYLTTANKMLFGKYVHDEYSGKTYNPPYGHKTDKPLWYLKDKGIKLIDNEMDVSRKKDLFEKGGKISYDDVKERVLDNYGYSVQDFHKGMMSRQEARQIMRETNELYLKLSKPKREDLGMLKYAKGGDTKNRFGELSFDDIDKVFGVDLFVLSEDEVDTELESLTKDWKEMEEEERQDILEERGYEKGGEIIVSDDDGEVERVKGSIRVIIADNFDDHKGYKEGEVLDIEEIDADDYMITNEGYYLSEAEVDFDDKESQDVYFKIMNSRYAKGGMTNEEKWHLLYDFLDQRHLEGEEEAGRIMNEDGYDVTYERLYDYTDERMVEGDEEAERVLEKVNKYGRGGYRANRPSPSVSATEFLVGTKKRGNDGNLWEIRANINGVHRWVKLSNYAKGGMAKGGMYSGIKEGKKVEVADYYIKDEVGQRAKATPTAIILSEPSDDEELVMVQYTNGSIDYVPQDVIEVLPFAKGGKLGEGYVIVDVYWGDNLEWNMDYVGYEGSFGLDKAILFYTKKDAEKYLKDERPDIKEEAKDNENYLEKYDLIQKVKVIARGYGEEDTIELMNSKLKTYISDINANKYAKGGNTPKFRVNQIPARMSGYDGTDKYWVIDAKSGDIKLKGDKRRCDALCKKLNSQDYAKGGETDKGLTGDQRDRMTDDIYMSEETMSDSMFQAIDDEVEGDWDVGLYRLSDSQLKKIHTDIKEDRASSYTEHKKGGEVDYESMSKQELVDRFMDKRSADLDKMTDKEVIDEYKEWFEVWDVFEEEDSHKSISKLKQELLEDEESWKWDYDKDELIDIQDDYDKYLAKGGLVKVREAIEYDENNFGQRKKLDLEKGSRNWRGLYLDIIPLVWSRNMQDGYEIYVSENRKHLGTINVDYNKRPTEISVYAKGGEVILDDYILTLKPDLTIPNEAPPFDNKDIVDTLPSSAPIFINEQFTSDWGTTWFIEQEQYDKLKSNKPITIEGGNASWDWKFKVTRDMVEKIEKRTMTKEGVKFAKGGSLEFDEGDVIVDNKEFKDLKFYRDRGGEEIEIVSDYDSGYAKIRYDEEMKDREYIVINDTVYYLDDLEVYAKGGGVKGVDYYDRLKLARKVRVKISELRKKKKTSTEITKALNSDPELSKLAKKVGKYPFKPI